ncbi:MAG: M81 family metallopeptidase [Chloroflexi bacterium]|nr:M81 family metallopeptidase [Chloroflexota bacterium]MCL5275744.1 M81 family metallopeptidase [Chloroflexota bacterium]
MVRILVAECKQEVSTFNPLLSHYDDFEVTRGDEMLRYQRRVKNEINGALSVFDQCADVEVVPAYAARAITSGGTLASADFQRLASEFLDSLRSAPAVDAAYFALHGAMASEDEDDPEGYLLAEARQILGERMPIVVSYDLHGILTDRMLQHADASVVYHTYPHTDFYETGQRAARLLLWIMSGAVRPVTAKVFVPALVRGDELITATGLIRHAVQAAHAVENSAGGLSAGLFWGNPFTDVAALGTNSMVTTDGDSARAEREALHIADLFWRHHKAMQVPLTSIQDAVSAAINAAGATIMVDAADATSSGASGDSNAILCELLARGYRGKALLPIVDPPAVRAAVAAGVGETIRTQVGGAIDPRRFTPLHVEGRVVSLSDGHIISESYGEHWNAGETAVLQVGSYSLVLTSRAVSLYDRSLFYANGLDPQHFDAVIVKSPQCQPHMFRDWAAQYIDVDAPGATSANLRSLGHQRCGRPMFPLDNDVTYTPTVRVFSRSGGAS